jgi:hypothetical protein
LAIDRLVSSAASFFRLIRRCYETDACSKATRNNVASVLSACVAESAFAALRLAEMIKVVNG